MNFRLAVFILLALLILAAVHLFFFAQNITLKYQITDAMVTLSDLNSKIRTLGSDVARKENLVVMEKSAREKLGMVEPERIIYLISSREAAPRKR